MNIHEETLKIARNLIKKTPSLTDWVISKFPELKESEDERIRDEIVLYIGAKDDISLDTHNKWLSWLEKQGGHANFRNKIQVGDKVTRNQDGVLVNLSQLDRVAKKYNITGIGSKNAQGKLGEMIKNLKPTIEMKSPEESLGISSKEYNEIVNECLYGEQNPADKVEPKFHEGEWITNGNYTWKIVEVKPLDYILQSQNGNTVDDTIFHVDEQFHSFTIQDAKDGDVLACNNV